MTNANTIRYTYNMKCENMGIEQKPLSIKAPLSRSEQTKYKRFLKKYGFTSGAWVRSVILNAMNNEEQIRSGGTK